MIREINKEKRLAFCKQLENTDDTLENIVWTDEYSVQLERHSKRCYRKKGRPKKLKPRPKHPLKVHLWRGISCCGATKWVIFTGKLNATRLIKIYEASLVPFVKSPYPGGHRLMQDNDPKHNSKLARAYLIENGIHWWETPPESPDH